MTDKMKSILVTGANKGIGYEAVKLLSQRDSSSKIILATRTIQNGEDAIRKMQSAVPSHKFTNVTLLELDITSTSSLQRAVDKVKSEFGQLDVLIHNSAISSADGDENSKKILDTNVKGAHDTVNAFLPLIPRNGTIVVVSSIVGSWSLAAFNDTLRARLLDDPKKVTWPLIEGLCDDWYAYAKGKSHQESWPAISSTTNGYFISKGFLSPWCRSFAAEHPEINLAVVCPGYCATDLNNNQGTRPASDGAESICWPLYNKFESGHFYQDGKEMSFVIPMPSSW